MPTILVTVLTTFGSLFLPFIKEKIKKLSDTYIDHEFNKKLENHRAQLQKENEKYKKELEESLELVRKEHRQELINYDLFTNQVFIIYPKVYGLIQKSLNDIWLNNTIYSVPKAEDSKSPEELEELLLQLEATTKEIQQLKLSFQTDEKGDFAFKFLEFYSNLKKRKTMEKNEITFSYFLENKIYFSQEMINLVETFYLNLKMHSQDQNTSFSKKSLDYEEIFLTTNNKILQQIKKELQNKNN